MMKETIGVLIAAILLVSAAGCGREPVPGELEGTITISGAWALYPLVVRWAEEFKKLHPAVRIDISAGGAGKGMADALGQVVDLGMVSREVYPAEIEKGAWWLAVAKDAVVPVMNRENPASTSASAAVAGRPRSWRRASSMRPRSAAGSHSATSRA